MRRLCLACAVSFATALAPGLARAQDPAGGNDPSAGSPAGTIYQIPLDTARHDAAPRPKGGGGGAGGGPSPSPLRSENNFGSSSHVPGASTPRALGGGRGTAGGGTRTAGSGGSGGTSRNGGSGDAKAGSASKPSTSSSRNSAASREALIRAPHARPSSTRTYLLLAAAVAVALALAAAGRLVARRR